MVMLSRSLESRLHEALGRFRAVAVVGGRQVGKSTLVRGLVGRHFVTLDDLGALGAAQGDPRGFVASLPLPATIDEIQRVPQLLLAIKEAVDRERRPGAFLVTGSSRLDTLRGLRESLAGRMALMTLRPLTVLEISGRPEASPIDRLFECADIRAAASLFAQAAPLEGLSPATYLAGGFPEPVLHFDPQGRRAWYREYVRTYIERDVPALLRVDELPALVRFLTACAATTSQLVNITDLARDTGVSVDTARRWLGLLEATFIAERRTPFWRNIRKRLVKSPKLYLCDSGLAAGILGITDWPAGATAGLGGHLFETWVHAQLAAMAELAQTPTDLHFFRTHAQREVDFVLTRPDALIGIEVKHRATALPTDALGIESMKELLGDDLRFGIVLYTGDSVHPLTANAIAVPLASFFGA